MKKSILFLSIIVTALICGCKSQPDQVQAGPQPPKLPVSTIISGTGSTYQDYPASIEGVVNLEIRPQVSGTLDKVFVDEGAFVSTGQPIFKIDDQPYRAVLNNAIATLHAAQAAQQNAQLEIEKLTPLVENKVVSEYQLKTARSAYQVATANIESANANVSAAQINLGYTLIRAPVSGYVGRLERKQGSLVGPGSNFTYPIIRCPQRTRLLFPRRK